MSERRKSIFQSAVEYVSLLSPWRLLGRGGDDEQGSSGENEEEQLQETQKNLDGQFSASKNDKGERSGLSLPDDGVGESSGLSLPDDGVGDEIVEEEDAEHTHKEAQRASSAPRRQSKPERPGGTVTSPRPKLKGNKLSAKRAPQRGKAGKQTDQPTTKRTAARKPSIATGMKKAASAATEEKKGKESKVQEAKKAQPKKKEPAALSSQQHKRKRAEPQTTTSNNKKARKGVTATTEEKTQQAQTNVEPSKKKRGRASSKPGNKEDKNNKEESGSSAKKKLAAKQDADAPTAVTSKTPQKPARKAQATQKNKNKKTSTTAARPAAVKSEPARRSGRSTGLRKGHYNEKRLAHAAYRGTGTGHDPIVL